MKIELKEIEYLVSQKLIKTRKHPTLPLTVYTYTKECEFRGFWNYYSRMSRGLVLDNLGNVIINPMLKFFNIEEADSKVPDGLSYEVFEKLDGSMINMAYYEDELIVTSKGSFESEQSEKAKELLKNKYANAKFEKGYTYVFEIIYPENRIVVDYGDEEKLVLLAIRTTENGEESSSEDMKKFANVNGFDIAEQFELDMNDLRLYEKYEKEFKNKEGFVVRFSNGHRVKIKYEIYFLLHRLFTNTSDKDIVETLEKGKSILDLICEKNIPDESFEFFMNKEAYFKNLYSKIENDSKKAFSALMNNIKSVKGKKKKKTFAINVNSSFKSFAPILFRMFDEQSYDKLIWKKIRAEIKSGIHSTET